MDAESTYTWFKLLQEVIVSVAGVVAIAVAWHQYRQRVVASAREWSPLATHTATAIAAALVPAVIWLNSDRLAQNAESEITDELRLQSERIDASINERFGGIGGNIERVTERLDETITAVYGLQTRLAVVETGLAERGAADMEQTTNDAVADASGDSPALPVGPEPPREPEVRLRTFDRGDTNGHCQSPRNINWKIMASEGWRIVEESITVRPTVKSQKSVFDGVEQDSSRNFFTVRGRLVNHGNCIRAFGTTLARDARGSLRVAGTYEERRIAE